MNTINNIFKEPEKTGMERLVEEEFDNLKIDLKYIDMKFKKLVEIENIEDYQNIINPIYAAAIMKAYSKYFGLKMENINLK